VVVTVALPDTRGGFQAGSPEMAEERDDAWGGPSVAFIPAKEAFGIEIVVNFGLVAGRAATHAEIDRLAEWLLDTVDAVTIVGEERHEIGAGAEGVVQQVRIEVAEGAVPDDASARGALEERLLERAEHWARGCVS
jgi:hypothetical protein